MAELRVLVCDDDADMLELMLRRLDKMGFKPDRAPDGGVASTLIKENLYDLIITDIYMPEATGLELLQLAKQRDAHVQVVIVTASATLDNAIHALNHGAFGYLTKPFDHLSVFDNTVSRALEFRQLIMANRRMAEAQKMRGDMLEDEVAKRVGQLREKQQGLLDLLNCLPDGILVVEEGGKLLMTSPAAEQWLARDRRADQHPIADFLGQVHSEWGEANAYARLGDESLRLVSVDYPHPNGKKRKAVIIRRAEEETSAGPGSLAIESLAAIKQGLAWLFSQKLSSAMRERVRELANHISMLEQLTGGVAEAAPAATAGGPSLEPARLPEYLRHEPRLDEPGAHWEDPELAARGNGREAAQGGAAAEPDTQPSGAAAPMPKAEPRPAEAVPPYGTEPIAAQSGPSAPELEPTQPEPEPKASAPAIAPESIASDLGLMAAGPEPISEELASAPTRVLANRAASAEPAATQAELETAIAGPETEEVAEVPVEWVPGEPTTAAPPGEEQAVPVHADASGLVADTNADAKRALAEDSGRIPLWQRFSKPRGSPQQRAATAPERQDRPVLQPEVEEPEAELEPVAELSARLEALGSRDRKQEPAPRPEASRKPEPGAAPEPSPAPRPSKPSIASAKAKAVVAARSPRPVSEQKAASPEPSPAPPRGPKKAWPPKLPSQDPDFNPELDVTG